MSYSQGAAEVPYRDPIASLAMQDGARRGATLGAFPGGLGIPLPPPSVIYGAIKVVQGWFGGGGNTDPASAVWSKIQPGDESVLEVLNVHVGADGKWYDATTNALLSQEDADFRSESLMAQLIGATMRSDRYWYDNQTNQRLTSQEAFSRWETSYGPGATLESVVASGAAYHAPQTATPAGTAWTAPTSTSSPTNARPAGTSVQSASLLPTAGMSPMTLALVAGGALALILLAKKRGR